MRILHLSDTHSHHIELPPLPDADVIVHSGDFTFGGSEQEAYDFMNWFCDLPHPHKIFIAGNHDMCMFGADKIEGLPENVHYLCNSGVEIDGVRFWGVPMFMEDCMSGKYNEYISAIPSDTDVLITHQPPRGICDIADYGSGPTNHGSLELAKYVGKLHLKYHLFGHEHDANGVIRKGNTVFSNASVMDSRYNLVGKARLFEL